jgi:hypothetical protein
MSIKIIFEKDWNDEKDKKSENYTVDKKYCANSWDTTIGELYIPKVYTKKLTEKALQITFREWIQMSMNYKTEDDDGLKLDKAVVNIVDRNICVLTEREMMQIGGSEIYFRNIADGLDSLYGARLHGLINKYFNNTCLRGEWKTMNRKIKARTLTTKNDSKGRKGDTIMI